MAFRTTALFLLGMLIISSVAEVEGRRMDDEKAAAGLVDCWGALVEIKSCSGELFKYFFSDGRVDVISDECCRAVATITHKCWPAMLDSVGFTAHQAHLLRGYCNAALADADGHAPTPAPAPVNARTPFA